VIAPNHQPTRDASRAASVVDGVLLFVALFAGAAARVLSVRALVLSGPGALLLSTDPYYHARRIQHAVRHFPSVPEFDPFVNFPEGARIIWPKGFDLLLASAARLALPDPRPDLVERFCALAIPLLGVLAIVAVYALARVSLGRPAAGVAAIAFAFLQFPVDYSLLGYVDHHVVEPLFLAIAGALLLAGLERRGARAAALGAAAGVAAALSCAFVTIGMAIVILIGALATFEGLRGRLPGARPAAIAAVAGSAIALLPLCAMTPWGRSGEYTYLALSPFQAHLAVAGAALALAGVLGTARALPARGRAVAAGVGTAVAAAAIAHGGTALIEPIREAAGFLTRRDLLVSSVLESQPLSSQGWSGALFALTPLGFLAPALLATAAWRDRGRAAGPAAILCLAIFAMGLAQLRFLPMGSIAVAWGAGRLAAFVWDLAARLPHAAWGRLAATAAIVAGFPATRLAGHDPIERLAPHRDALDLAEEFRTVLRDPRVDTDRFDVRPPWGVIAPWSLGHLLLYRGGVAVVASPFGQAAWHIEGVRRVLRFSLAESDAEAAARCRRLGALYVVTANPLTGVLKDTKVLGLPTDRYVEARPQPGGGLGVWITPAFLQTAGFRLHMLDASAVSAPGVAIAAMPSFRLVWESQGRVDERITSTGSLRFPQPAYYKLFEVVAGARVEGRCAPGAPVTIATQRMTNLGRIFDWHDETPCAPEGRYALRAPYAASYRVIQGGRVREVEITDAQTREGARVQADLESPVGNR